MKNKEFSKSRRQMFVEQLEDSLSLESVHEYDHLQLPDEAKTTINSGLVSPLGYMGIKSKHVGRSTNFTELKASGMNISMKKSDM